MQENISLVDLVIELVDARIPMSSRNPDIDELGKNKARIILLNKADLADPSVNARWMDYFKEKGFLHWRSTQGQEPACVIFSPWCWKPVRKR